VTETDPPTDHASALAVFGVHLRRFRLRRGFTQEDLAERAAVSRATIASLEQGKPSSPHVRTVGALADALQLEPVDRVAFLQLASAAPIHPNRGTPNPPSQEKSPAGHGPLPVPATRLIGREHEVAGARERLHPSRGAVRLLTLHGPGGVGKTRLALAVAKAANADYADGVVFVDLAPLREHRLVGAKIAWAVGLHETSNQSARDLLLAHLADRQLLLVLDNFEHLLEAGPLLSDILAACPRVAMLVTSRARLGLRGEQRYVVDPLASPTAGPDQSVATVGAASAVQLFVERAREVSPSFALTVANASAVAEICRHLDGLPLCIELAAGRAGLLSPEEIVRRLDRRLSLLTNGPLDVPARQQTLRQTLEWSYELLTEDEQRLFRHMAVFAGGCTLEAAQMMLGRASAEDVLQLVGSLLDKSLVRRSDNHDGTLRLVLLETLREYGLDQLSVHGELTAARNSHLHWCLQLAEPLQPDRTDPLEVALLEKEQDNFRAALRWCIETNQAAHGMRLGERAWLFWYMRGRWTEGRAWLGELVALPAAQKPSPERAAALAAAGQLAIDQNDFGAAEALLSESEQIAEQVGDEHTRALSVFYRAGAARIRGESSTALTLFENSLQIYQRLEDSWSVAMTLQSLASVTFEMGGVDRAEQLANVALVLFREQRHMWGVGRSMALLGRTAQQRDDQATARSFLAEALSIQRQQADGQGMTWSMLYLARTALAQNDLAEARQLLEDSLTRALESGDRLSVARGLELVAVAAINQLPVAAVRLLAAAFALREPLHSAAYPHEREQLERCLAVGRSVLDPAALEAATQAGEGFRLEQAIAEALGALSSLKNEE
jgi:predicted ATPase/DNA-binding XRE family transcriptional regulator